MSFHDCAPPLRHCVSPPRCWFFHHLSASYDARPTLQEAEHHALRANVKDADYEDAYHRARAICNLVARSDFRGHPPDTDPAEIVLEVCLSSGPEKTGTGGGKDGRASCVSAPTF